jgi:hypothetical protein
LLLLATYFLLAIQSYSYRHIYYRPAVPIPTGGQED